MLQTRDFLEIAMFVATKAANAARIRLSGENKKARATRGLFRNSRAEN
jgi:hypothetical protein